MEEYELKRTCLYPFYEYIIKEWIQHGVELKEYKDIVQMPETVLEGNRLELEKRKKSIWDNTKNLLALSEQQKEIKFGELKNIACDCKLCLFCVQCERYYWEQLERALADGKGDSNREKCEFLIPDDIKQLLEQKDKPVDVYLDFYKRRYINKDNFLVMLKGFSSSTPILLNYAQNTNLYSGGGFYFRWNGLGVAVDPGYLFIQNLHNYGLSVLDIDVVVVTHEHIDHSSDVRLLDDLHYNVASNNKEKEVGWNRDTFSLLNGKTPNHTIKWYLDEVTYEEARLFQKKKSGFAPEYNELYCLLLNDTENPKIKRPCVEKPQLIEESTLKIAGDISMKVFPTRHEQYEENNKRIFFKHTFGCVFECVDKFGENKSIGYTSDTSLQQDISSLMYESLKECQVLIMNISGIYEDDILLQKGKDRHLGYYGCYEIISNLLKTPECKLKYCLLSEFANQISDIRYSIAKYMQKEINKLTEYNSKNKITVVPTEIGLTINLSTLHTKCTACGNYSTKIYVLKPFGENATLQYICPECMYSD